MIGIAEILELLREIDPGTATVVAILLYLMRDRILPKGLWPIKAKPLERPEPLRAAKSSDLQLPEQDEDQQADLHRKIDDVREDTRHMRAALDVIKDRLDRRAR